MSVQHEWRTTLPVMWPRPCCTVTDMSWNLAGVGSQQINERTWKRTPLLGEKMHCIDQKGTYSPLQIQQEKCVCVCLCEGCVGALPGSSNVRLFCQNPNHKQLFTWVNFCGHLNFYDSHPFCHLHSSLFLFGLPTSIRPVLTPLTVTPPFPCLLFSSLVLSHISLSSPALDLHP